jgi:flagellar biosynthesis chaperone FliJ
MTKPSDTSLSKAMTQNSMKLIQPALGDSLVRKAGSAKKQQANAPTQDTVELSGVKRKQVDTAQTFLKELQKTQSDFQAVNSAFQDLAETMINGSDDELQQAGDRSLKLLERIATVQAERELSEIRSKLENTDKASFADVVQAVAVLAKLAKNGTESTSMDDMAALADMVGLINEALSKAQTRLENLTSTVSQANQKAAEELQSREGLERMVSALGAAMKGSRQDAMNAQANVDSALVARMLQDTPDQ